MEILLDGLNCHGFAFTRDFVLKTCLTVLGHGARYEVEKFRKRGVREEIETKWDNITAAISDVLDFVRGKTYIRCDKALPSYLVLIPLIYVRFHFGDAWKQAKDVDQYLLRSSLAGAFGGTPDQLIDDLVKEIRRNHGFAINDVFGVIRSQNRSLELTEDRLWYMGYASDNIHLLFNLRYRDFNYVPSYENNLPQIYHIFPQSRLRKVKTVKPHTDVMNVMRYHEAERNQLANCMLLTAEENGAGGKSDLPPDQWFTGPRGEDQYLETHLIPRDPVLWKLDRFDDFISERRKLIAERLKWLVVIPAEADAKKQDALIGGDHKKSMASLIDAGLIKDQEALSAKVAKPKRAKAPKEATTRGTPEYDAVMAARRTSQGKSGITAEVVAMLKRKWTSLPDILAHAGWQPTTFRGLMSLEKKKLGFTMERRKVEGVTQYRIVA
jgi:Protein of unknown function (DUF3489)/Protein of unknown function (DUF1524)